VVGFCRGGPERRRQSDCDGVAVEWNELKWRIATRGGSRESIQLPDGVAPPSGGAEGASGRVGAVELSVDAGPDCDAAGGIVFL